MKGNTFLERSNCCHSDTFNIQVLKQFAVQFNFSGLTFDAALRAFLESFRLPGEAQKIDRIMEVFAQRFCEQNSSAFENADTAYILAFSVIMLNTGLNFVYATYSFI